MKDFTNPVNMVYSYEVAQTPQNKRLKGLLMDVRMHLRATVNALRRMVRMRKKVFLLTCIAVIKTLKSSKLNAQINVPFLFVTNSW